MLSILLGIHRTVPVAIVFEQSQLDRLDLNALHIKSDIAVHSYSTRSLTIVLDKERHVANAPEANHNYKMQRISRNPPSEWMYIYCLPQGNRMVCNFP